MDCQPSPCHEREAPILAPCRRHPHRALFRSLFRGKPLDLYRYARDHEWRCLDGIHRLPRGDMVHVATGRHVRHTLRKRLSIRKDMQGYPAGSDGWLRICGD